MSLAIVVPVKSPARAKHRLEPILSEAERARLATTMAADVFSAAAAVDEYTRFVVSDDPAVLEQARGFGFEPVLDRVNQGQSAAVQQGFSRAWEQGFTSALTIPGDVPGVTPGELRELATYRPEIEVVLVSDREHVGTNGLRLVPPHVIALRFGEDSLNLHRQEAARANRSVAVLELAGLEHDIDRPDDIFAFLALGRATRTLRLLEELQAADRVLASAPPRG